MDDLTPIIDDDNLSRSFCFDSIQIPLHCEDGADFRAANLDSLQPTKIIKIYSQCSNSLSA